MPSYADHVRDTEGIPLNRLKVTKMIQLLKTRNEVVFNGVAKVIFQNAEFFFAEFRPRNLAQACGFLWGMVTNFPGVR